MPQIVDSALVAVINSRAYSALQTTRRNTGNTAYEFATGVWTDQSYADPAWITSLAASKLAGTTLAANVVTSSLTTIGTLVGGSIPYSLVTGGPSTQTITLTGDVTGSGTGTFAATINLGITPTWIGKHIHSLSNASAWAIGPNGDTNPVVRVVTNVASQADGASFTGGAAGAGFTIAALSSGSNAPITAVPKGTGAFVVQQPGGTPGTDEIQLSHDGTIGLIVAKDTGGLRIGTTSATGWGATFSSAVGANIGTSTAYLSVSTAGLATINAGKYGWCSTGDAAATVDTAFSRNAAGVVEVNNGTAGTLRGLKIGNTSTILPALTQVGIASRTAAITSYTTSAAGSLGNVSGGRILNLFVPVSTTSTDGTFDTLWTVPTVANALIVNGDSIYFDFTLTKVSSATKADDEKLAFAGITFFDTGALVAGLGAATIHIWGQITRVTSTTAIATIHYVKSIGVVAINDYVTAVPTATLTGLTLSGANNLVLSAASTIGAASGDITLTDGSVWVDGFGS